MRRLSVLLLNDFKLLFRHNLVHATVFMTAFWMVMMFLIAHFEGWIAVKAFTPILLLTDTATIGFYFIAGQILFEKDQKVLDGLAVTPIKPLEYISAKVISLGTLTLFSGLTIAVYAVWGSAVNLTWPIVGRALISLFYALIGFISVSRFKNFVKYMFISVLFFIFLNIPLLSLFGLVDHFLMYFHPAQPFYVMVSAPFMGIEPWEIAYSVGYGLVVILVSFWFAVGSYQVHMIRKGY